MDEKVRYWVELAEYDLETADAMLRTKRYVYVGFMCHQALEKILKAYHQRKTGTMPPKTHNLRRLAEESGLDDEFSESQKDLIALLDPLNIETRYPVHRERLHRSLSEQRCSEMLQSTKELYQWIRNKL